MLRSNLILFPFFFLLTTVGVGADASQTGPCSVCGVGKQVGTPNAIFDYSPGQPAMSCGKLERVGQQGLIPLDECPLWPMLIDGVCGCRPGQSDDDSGDAPTLLCNICGTHGYHLIDPEGTVQVPGVDGTSTCSSLERQAELGVISKGDAICDSLPNLVDESCGCTAYNLQTTTADTSPSAAPTAAAKDDEIVLFLSAYLIHILLLFAFVGGLLMGLFLIGKARLTGTNGEQITNSSNNGAMPSLGSAMLYVGWSNNGSPSPATIAAGISEDQLETAKLMVDSKLRPQILQMLFPEQKATTSNSTPSEDPKAVGDNTETNAAVSSTADNVDATASVGSANDAINDTTTTTGDIENPIQKDTTTAAYSAGDAQETSQSFKSPCSICLEELDEENAGSVIVGNSCSHVYHRECILEWLNTPNKKVKQKKHEECPNCRQPMWDPEEYQRIKDKLLKEEQEEQGDE